MSSIAWPHSWAAEVRRPPAWGLAALLAVAYLAIDPPSADLAGQEYRARLGLVLWDNAWYGGHHMPGYSVLYPPLGAVLGPRLAGALAAVAATALFERLALSRCGERARAGTLWFAIGTAPVLISGRLTFALGVAIGLGAVFAATLGRAGVAGALGVLTSLASPVAGAFLVLAGTAWWLVDRRRPAAALVAGGLTAAVALRILFPGGGTFPFVGPAFWPSLALVVAVLAALPRAEGGLRAGTALYAVAMVACFGLATPMGGNVTRLGTLFAGPLVACALWGRRPRSLALLAVPLLTWQWVTPIDDWLQAGDDPSVRASYYTGLLRFLDTRRGPFRVEIPFTDNHWEARWVAARHPLARGWERQLDVERNGLFYDGRPLTAQRYRRWLHANAVGYVALPDAPIDYSAAAEARLIRDGLPYLRQVFRDRHWRVFAVAGAPPLARGAAAVVDLGRQSVDLRARRPGTVDVRVRYSPYWRLAAGRGCVERAYGGWTRVRLRAAGRVRLEASFSLAAPGSAGARCAM